MLAYVTTRDVRNTVIPDAVWVTHPPRHINRAPRRSVRRALRLLTRSDFVIPSYRWSFGSPAAHERGGPEYRAERPGNAGAVGARPRRDQGLRRHAGPRGRVVRGPRWRGPRAGGR